MEQKPKQEKPKVDKAVVKQAIKDKEEIIKKRQIVNK